MKPGRWGSMGFGCLPPGARRCATSGRSRSLATTVFFEAQLLGVDEVPDCPIIDLQPALGEFGDKPAQPEAPCLGALQQPGTVLPRNCLRLVPPPLPWPTAARPPHRPHPSTLQPP